MVKGCVKKPLKRLIRETSAVDVTLVMEEVTPIDAGYMKVEWHQTKTGL